MESFRKNVECIERRCRKYEKVLALFDYDGTLSPIVRDPRRASMSPKHREWITRLTRDPKVEVGIVTGRDLHDIRKRLAMPKLLVAGSHGYEIVRRGKLVLKRSARDFAPMEDLAQELKAALGDVPRLSIEHKQYSIAIHYRRVPPKDRARVRRTVDRLAAPYCEAHDWTITHQKMNREIRPADKWNKGKAIEWIWKKFAPRAMPFYIGDDATDEDAFRALGKRGITVRVGKVRSSAAHYYVHHIDEIEPWIEWLLNDF